MKKIIENNKCLYFLKELLKYKKEIGILSISTIVSTVTVFLQPLLIKQITDIGILEKNMPQIVNGVAGLFVCVLVYLMIEVVQAKTFAEIHNSFYKNLYCNVFRKLLHLKKHYFQMKNVRFQYTKDREVLKKVSFKLEPGEKVAIIGKKWKWKINNFGITITIL